MDFCSKLILMMMIQSACWAQEDDEDGEEVERTLRKGKLRPKQRILKARTVKPFLASVKKNSKLLGSKTNPDSARTSETQILRQLFTAPGYNKKDAPTLDHPTEVRLGIYVNSFYSISEQTMDYSVNFYFRQNWKDPRLQFEPFDGGKSTIKMAENGWTFIWIPDVFFRNEKAAHFHTITVPNRFMTVNSSGFVWYSTKISATLSCPMKLQKYPLDTQTCPMMFESFGYTMDTIFFAWLDSPIDVDPSVQLPQFTMQDNILYDCSQNYTAGAFPCLEIRFVLRRDIGYFLIQVYIPSILIVILSWVSFWINIDAIPARVSLGLLTVLTMTTQSSGARSTLPRVSYIKAIDVWMSMCLIFVFTSLLEFAVVNVMSRKEVRTIKPVNIVENGSEPERKVGPKKVDPMGKHRARSIDKMSRKAFPLAFLMFNLAYWIFYTLPPSDTGII